MVLLAVVLLGASCGGSSTPQAPTATLAPPPISPTLRAVGSGSVDLNVPANGRQELDTQMLAKGFNNPPDCNGLVFLFSWQVPAKHSLLFDGLQQDGKSVVVAQGQSGQASVGCMHISVVNGESKPLTGSLRYIVAEKP